MIIAAWASWSLPLDSQATAVIQYSVRTDAQLAGILSDRSQGAPVAFSATSENGLVTLQINLDEQTITVRKRANELYIGSSRNRGGVIATLSESEKDALRRAVAAMDGELPETTFETEVACMLRQFSAWPDTMPLLVSRDHLKTTVGTVSVANKDIDAARREALARDIPEGATEPLPAPAIVSYCNVIGRAKAACYPTSVSPYREKCVTTLVGGLKCQGRCGTLCNGLCSGQRYTADCLNHDKCTELLGLNHANCNFIFSRAFDDCFGAASCTDTPGVWTLKTTWKGSAPKTVTLNILPTAAKTFTDSARGAGKWSVTGATLKLTYSNGCKPVFTGKLNANRTGLAAGTMKCTVGKLAGTWSATKTNGILK
jgi:hypothetical protein